MCAAAGLATAGAGAHADQPLWEAGLGVGVLRLPHYSGSDQSHTWVLPVPYFVYRGEVVKADREGARAVLFNGERVDFDLSVAATAPTRSSDDEARRDMPDLAPTFEIGPNLNLTLARGSSWKLQARAPARAAFTFESDPKMIGWLASPNLNVDVRVDGWNIGVLAGPLFGSRRLNGYFYDVAPQFATASRPSYSAPGGFAGWRLVSGVSRRLGPLWLGGFVAAGTLRGAQFENSPLVRQRDTLAFGVAVSWVFATSSERVPDED
jgi:outer membrane scaffolding protein for murein synthesis (MipA/OmpV family)